MNDETRTPAIALRQDGISSDISYLEDISERFRQGQEVLRTPRQVSADVSLTLLREDGSKVMVRIPDRSGEIVLDALEEREWPTAVDEAVVAARAVLVFIHVERVLPGPSIDEVASLEHLIGSDQGIQQHADDATPVDLAGVERAPSDVLLVDLMQVVRARQHDARQIRIGLVLSAWDLAEGNFPSALAFMQSQLPFSLSFLRSNPEIKWEVFGVSATGAAITLAMPPAEGSRSRVLVGDGTEPRDDITIPLGWALQIG